MVMITDSSEAEYVGNCLGVIPYGPIPREIPNEICKTAPCIAGDSHPFQWSSNVLQQLRIAEDVNSRLAVQQDPHLWDLTIGLVETKQQCIDSIPTGWAIISLASWLVATSVVWAFW